MLFNDCHCSRQTKIPMTTRLQLLQTLLTCPQPIAPILDQLNLYPWDSEPLICLEPHHLIPLLQGYVDGHLTGATLETWANAIESRDDIDYAPDLSLQTIIETIANPLLTEPLTPHLAQTWLTRLKTPTPV